MHRFSSLGTVALAALLSACGGSSDPAPATLTVTPSLGLIQNGTITLKTLSGQTLGQQGTGSGGAASFTLPAGATGPFLITVCGGTGASYYDEGLNAQAPLTASQCLRALVPDTSRLNVGVTALTEAAVHYLESNGGLSTATAGQIATAHELVRSRLAPSLDNILTAPQLLSNLANTKTLINSDNGLGLKNNQPANASAYYAYRLAIMALAATQHAQAEGAIPTAPAYELAQALAQDFADAKLDGLEQGVYLRSAVYDARQFSFGLLVAAVNLSDNEILRSYAGSPTGLMLLAILGGFPGVTLPSVVLDIPQAGDDLQSWAGRYQGKWQDIAGPLDQGEQFTSLLPAAYQPLIPQLVNDKACDIIIEKGQVHISGLSFAVTEMSASAVGGVREFALARDDTAVGSVTVTVATTGSLRMSNDQVAGAELSSIVKVYAHVPPGPPMLVTFFDPVTYHCKVGS